MPWKHHGLGDATGARSGPLAKIAVLHRTSCDYQNPPEAPVVTGSYREMQPDEAGRALHGKQDLPV